MKLYSWNVNGIRAVIRKGAIQDFIAEHNPDLLCVQEIKAKPEQIEFDFQGYQTYWHSAERPGYSGTGILTRLKPQNVIEGFPEEIVSEYHLDDGYGNSGDEGRVLVLEFDKFFLLTVYTPNAKDDLTRLDLRHKAWDPAFLQYVKTLEEQKPVILCGDLNVARNEEDLARPIIEVKDFDNGKIDYEIYTFGNENVVMAWANTF